MGISEKRRMLNEAYYPLELKRAELFHALFHKMFELTSGFYNGHYHETADGEYQMDYYPIPVISVEGLCDIEIDFDGISVSTKRKRQDVLECSFECLEGRAFEIYGVEDYLNTYYRAGMSLEDMRKNIARSSEREIGFCFSFPFEVEGKEIFAFAKLLRREGFYD